MKRIIVIGAGLHYREKYHQVLENKEIVLVVDLKSQESVIRSFFDKRPRRYLFLPEAYRNTISSEQIAKFIGEVEADCVLICTEPKVRAQYGHWAASRGYPMFLDKPATITLTDFEKLLAAKPYAVLSCERRAHSGYLRLFAIIDSFFAKYRVPLTGVDIHFAGGIWKIPREYVEEENHPFRYGYGMIMHSGYHFIDLLVRLLRYSSGNQMRMQANCSTPEDHVLGNGRFEYPHLFQDNQMERPGLMEGYGETDVMLIGQMLQEGRVATNFSLKMLGTSLSMRSGLERGEKLPGKIRQESVILHFGHLLSIQISSTQFQRIDPTGYPEENFTITVLRNPLLREKGVEQIIRSQITSDPESLNTAARKRQLCDFLSGGNGNSPLENHLETMRMTNKIYAELQPELCDIDIPSKKSFLPGSST